MKKFIEKGLKCSEAKESESKEAFVSSLIPDMVNWYLNESYKKQDMVAGLFNQMAEEKFITTLKKAMKKEKGDEILESSPGLIIVLNDFLAATSGKLTEEQKEIVSKIINKGIKKSKAKITEKVEIPEEVAQELLVVIPVPEIVDRKFSIISIQKLTKKLYNVAKVMDTKLTTVKQIKKLFKQILGEDMLIDAAGAILLERKEISSKFSTHQTEVWNLLTLFALETIEDQNKEDVKESILAYGARRKKDEMKGRDSERRIKVTSIDDEEKYPKIVKAVRKLAESGKIK